MAIIRSLGPQHVRWPTPSDQARHAQAVEEETGGLRHVVGFIDGTHVRIVPRNARERVYSYNRKEFHSIVLQGIVDRSMRFLNVFSGYLGRVHDARVFVNSPVAHRIASVPHQESILREPYVLVGDAAYPLCSWLVTPFPTEPTAREAVFNRRHSSARMAVERAFGKLKAQWSLLYKNSSYGPASTVYMCTAACILHNITIDVDDEHGWEPPEDELSGLMGSTPDVEDNDGVVPGDPSAARNMHEAGAVKRALMADALA